MDVSLKTPWVADLRSGNFTQTTGNLKDSMGFCCLGVLASRFADSWVGPKDGRLVPARNNVCLADGDFNDRTGKLSSDFLREVGLNHIQSAICMSANECGCTFDQVADIIEHPAFENPLGQQRLYQAGVVMAKRGRLAEWDDTGIPHKTPLTAADREMLKELES